MKIFNTLFIVLFVCASLSAQEFPYFLSVDSEPYADLTDVDDLTEGMVWDDPEIIADIGFDFELFGETVTSFYFNGLGTEMISDDDYYTNPVTYFTGYYADVIDRGYIDDVNLSSINSKVTGTPGNRVFHLEWKNVGFYNEQSELSTLEDYINFQMRFYEGSNDMEIHFGPSSITHEDIIYDFFDGPAIFFFDSLDASAYDPTFNAVHFLYGDSSDPLIGTSTDPDAYYNDIEPLDMHPVDGTVYRLSTSETSSTKDLDDLNAVVNVFPTLVDQTLMVDVAYGFDFETGRIQIINELGQMLLQQNLQNNRETLDLSNFPVGNYFVSIQTNTGIATKKVVKM